MSIRHPEFCSLVETLHAGRPLDAAGVRLLEAYAAPSQPGEVEDKLDSITEGLVAQLTGSANASTPRRAARALIPERIARRNITFSPRGGTPVIVSSRR